MKFEFVTSMHRPYFDHIGSVMIESWLKHWKDYDCKLVVYGEGFYHDFKSDKIVWRDWDEHCRESHVEYTNKTEGPCLTFAKKGFAFLNAMKQCSGSRLIWVDADLLFFKKFPLDKFVELLPDNKLIAFFDQFYLQNPNYTLEEYTNKETRPGYGAESGFIIVNTSHKNYDEYVKEYDALYNSEKKHQLLTHWYDSEVVVIAARNFLSEVEDLSKHRIGNKTQTPLNRSWLSEYFSHQKAKSKYQYTKEELRKMCGLNHEKN